MRRPHFPAPAVALALVLVLLPVAARAQELRGFRAPSARAEATWEAKFRALPDTARLRAMMQRLSARPHHVGSPGDSIAAAWIRDQYASFGWDAHIETFDVLFPTPTLRVLELVAPTRYQAKLEEPLVPEDSTSAAQRAEQLPPFNAYSVDGDVSGPLVFANYGTQADYDELARRGVSVKGAIVLVKYGRNFRGMKPKIAFEHGAIGCLIYSDPGDDGYAGGDVFPRGPMRPPQGVQRGSVEDLSSYPGDPLTPAIASLPGATRLAVKSAPTTITRIPVLPISYGDAQPLLTALGGPLAPAGWRGGLPITYRLGPGAARVHLALQFDWATKRLYDVVAKLPGTSEADQWVLRGNHHDAWVYGAEDPISGQVAELEEARALGQLYRQGWRPRRTIVYGSWDGEEPGLLGSTEWAEAHAPELTAHAVAYLNTDSNGRGFFDVAGSHALEHFINDVAKDIDDPETHVSSWRRSLAAAEVAGRTDVRAGDDLRIGALGSGSDFTPFLQHLGIASLNLGFGGEDDGGIYHSIYDDFYWYTHFSDTSFAYGRALAQAVGTAVMRLADADMLPFTFTNLAATTQRYLEDLQALRDTRSKQIAERRRQLEDSTFALASDPRQPLQPPVVEASPPHFDFSPLLNAQDSLSAAADRFDKAYTAWSKRAPSPAGEAMLRQVNERLSRAERAFLAENGLKDRPWYRHVLYAPGFYEGYGVKTMPGVREALEQGKWGDVDGEIARVAEALRREATALNEVSALVEAGR